MDKRGQGLSVNAIILIVLGVFVLALLIFGFTVGFGGITDLIKTDNVNTIVNACILACDTQSQYDFCTSPRDLKDADGVEVKDVTCNYLAEEQGKYGIDSCASVSCDNTILLNEGEFQYTSQDDLKSLCSTDLNKGKTIYLLNVDKDTLLSAECAP